MTQQVKNLHALQETQEMQVWSFGREDPLEEENGNPLQYSCLGKPMDRGAWQATVLRFTESDMTEAFCHKEEIHSEFCSSPLNLLQENKGWKREDLVRRA